MRRLVLNLHLAIALIAGTFMVLLGVTGSIMAFQPELDRLFHPHLSYVAPGFRALSLTEIGEAVSQKYGGEPIVATLPSASPNVATQVILSRGIVSINQYTGEVLGIRTRGQTFLGFVRALHVRLATGDVGKWIIKWSAVALLLSLASGLYLWWPAKRTKIRGRQWSAAFWFDLHNSVGAFSMLLLAVLAATGTVIGFEDQAESVLDKLTGSKPPGVPSFARPEWRNDAPQITPDQAVAIAGAQVPGADAYRVQMPRYGGIYVVAMEVRRDRIVGTRNEVAIDPWSGKVLFTSLASGLTARERVIATNEAIHMGEICGTPGKIVVALVGIFLPVQAVSGLAIWLWRRKTAGGGPTEGGLRK